MRNATHTDTDERPQDEPPQGGDVGSQPADDFGVGIDLEPAAPAAPASDTPETSEEERPRKRRRRSVAGHVVIELEATGLDLGRERRPNRTQ